MVGQAIQRPLLFSLKRTQKYNLSIIVKKSLLPKLMGAKLKGAELMDLKALSRHYDVRATTFNPIKYNTKAGAMERDHQFF